MGDYRWRRAEEQAAAAAYRRDNPREGSGRHRGGFDHEKPDPHTHVAAADGQTCARCGATVALRPVYASGERVCLVFRSSPGGSWRTQWRADCRARPVPASP